MISVIAAPAAFAFANITATCSLSYGATDSVIVQGSNTTNGSGTLSTLRALQDSSDTLIMKIRSSNHTICAFARSNLSMSVANASGQVASGVRQATEKGGEFWMASDGIHYKPAAGFSGTDRIAYGVSTAWVADAVAVNDPRGHYALTITVVPTATGPSITPGAATGTSVGASYSQANPASSGTTPYVYALATGALPAGTTLNAATGTVSGTPTTAGAFSYAIKVTDNNGAGSTATGSTVSGTIAQGAQVITFAALSDAGQSASPLTLAASVNSGLTVVFTSATTGVCTVSGTSLTLLTPGTCTINANQAGDANWSAATQVQRSFAVTASPVTTVQAQAAVNATVGTALTAIVPVTASGGTGTLTYALSGGTLPAGLSFSTSTGELTGTPTAALSSTTFTVTVTDQTTPTAQTSSKTFTLTVARASQTILFTSTAPSAQIGGATYTPTANATSGLTVSFTIAPASSGVCTITSGVVSFAAAGTCTIEANQAGDAAWSAASPVQQAVTVAPLQAATITLATSASSVTSGTTTLLTITFANPNAVVSPTIATTVSVSSSVLARVVGAAGGTCSSTGSIPALGQIAVGNVSIPANGSCTVTYSFTGATSGTTSFSSTAFTPSGWPTTSASTSNSVAVSPAVSSIAPTSGAIAGGTSVTINGRGFDTTPANNSVKFGSQNAVVTGATSTVLTVTAPSGSAGAVGVLVTTNSQASTSSAPQFTYVSAPVAAAKPGVAVAYNSAGTAIDLASSVTGVSTSLAVGTAPAHGSVTFSGTVATYVPTSGYFGADSFTYTATGPGGTSAPATVGVTVATPAAPVAAAKPGVAVAYNSAGTAIDLASSVTGVSTSLAVGTAPAHGSVTFSGTVATYVPTSGYFGADSFTYTATGPGGTSAPATVGVTVATPAAPVAAAKPGVAVAYNSAGTAIDLASSVTGVSTSLAVGTAPAHGSVTFSGTVATYVPTSGYFGADSFTYTATGPGGTSAPATVGVTVATPAAPVAAAKPGVAVAYNSAGTAIDLASSVTGVSTSLALGTAPAHGSVTFSGTVATYVPTSGYFGADSFTYTATGPGGTSAPATVGVTVATPAAPVAAAKPGVAVAYNSAGTAIDLASSVTGVSTSLAVGTAPAHGSVTFSGTVATYVPTSGYFGADSFTYTATGPGGTSAPATVGVTVATPAAPVAAAKPGVAVAYNSAGTAIDLASSVTGVSTSLAVGTAPAHGSVTFSGTVATYVPTSGYFGADSFTYTATGPGGTSAPATVGVTVATPAAPVAAAKPGVAVAYNSAGTAIDLASSVTGVSTSLAVGTAPAHGSVTFSGTVATYVPTSGYFGADSFTYTATGPGGTSAPATVGVTVATPAAPVAAAKPGVAVAYNSAGTAIDLASSVTGVSTSLALGTAPAHGSVTFSGTVATYVPTSGYFGADSFTYTATGPGGTSAPATVGVTVATPAAPVAAAKPGVAVAYNSAGTAIDLASSVTGVSTSLAVGTAPAHGSVTFSGTVATYVPTSGYFGADSFTYTATGPGGTSAPATVGVTVATPAAPVAAAKPGVAVAYNSAGTAIDLASSVTGVSTSLALGTAPAHGSVTFSGTVATYVPTSGYFGADSFTYTATGPGGTSAPATVGVTVATPAAPVAAAKPGVAVAYNSAGTAIDLASSVTGVSTSLAVGTAPAHGSVTFSGTVATYVPTSGYFGADSFTYTATGPGGTSAPATVGVTVATPAAPVAAAKPGVAVAYNSAGTAIDLASSVTGVSTGLALGTAPAHGSVTFSGTVATYVPTSGYFGADSFTYTATGPGGTSAPATVGVTVATPAAPVVAAKPGVAVAYNSAGTAIDLASSVTGVSTSLAVGTAPAHGSVTFSGTVATYVPTSGYFGADSFTYTATGPGGTSAPATVGVTVATPAAPVAAAKPGVAVAYNSAGTAIDLASSVTGVSTSLAVGTAPAHGSVTFSGTVATYVPTSGYFGADSFTYTATGPGGTSAPVTVGVTVETPPVAVPANVSDVSVPYGSAGTPIDLAGAVTGVYTSLAVDKAPAHGSVTISGAVATYVPASGYFGPDDFTYTATGPGGVSAPASVIVTIATPAAPVVTAKSGVEASYNSASAIDLGSSITGVSTVLTLGTAPAHGSVTFSGTIATYTPTSGYFGADSFTYTATGPGGTSAPASVTLTVVAPPPPATRAGSTTVQGSSSVTSGSSVNIELGALVSGEFSTIQIQNQPLHGTVVIQTVTAAMARLGIACGVGSAYTAVYRPNPGYVGPDSFTFVAVGPGGTSTPGTVSITVSGTAPTAAPKTAVTGDGQMVSVDLTAGATGGPFVAATIVSMTPADAATAKIVENGSGDSKTYRLEVTPKARFGGSVVLPIR
ncbi:Ig-like domain-containing protein [Sphingomonas sp. CJ20]